METIRTWGGAPDTLETLLTEFSSEDCGNIICAINVLIGAFTEITGERNWLDNYNGYFLLSKLKNYNLNDYLIWNSNTEDLTIQNLRDNLLPAVTKLPKEIGSHVEKNEGVNADYPDGLIILYKPETEQSYKCYKICTASDAWYAFCYNDLKKKAQDLTNPIEINKFFFDATGNTTPVPPQFNITLTQVGIIQPPKYYDAQSRAAYKTEKERPVGQIVLNIGDPKIRESMYIIPKDSVSVDILSSSETTLNRLNFRTNWFNHGPVGDFDGLEKWRAAYQLITRQLFFGSYAKHGRLTSQLTLGRATPAEYNNNDGPKWEKWCCSICGREIQGASKVKGYDVDHVFNLIFNTFFEVNDIPLGFLNACGGCNKWKSECIWVPNEDVWEGLKEKSKYKENEEPEYKWPMLRGPKIVSKLWKTGNADGGDRHLQGGMSNKNISPGDPCVNHYVLQYYYLNRLITILTTTRKGGEILTACTNGNSRGITLVKKNIVAVYERFAGIAQEMVSKGLLNREVYDAISEGRLNESWLANHGVDDKLRQSLLDNLKQQHDTGVIARTAENRKAAANAKDKGVVPGGISGTHDWSPDQTSKSRRGVPSSGPYVPSSQPYDDNSSPLGTPTKLSVSDSELEQAMEEIFSKTLVHEIVTALMDKNTLWGTMLSSNPWRDFYSFLGYRYRTQPPLGMDKQGTQNKRRLWDKSRTEVGEYPSSGGRGGFDLAYLKRTIIPSLFQLTKITATDIGDFLTKEGDREQVKQVGEQLGLSSGDDWTPNGFPQLDRPVYSGSKRAIYDKMCKAYVYRHNRYYFMQNFVEGLGAEVRARERLFTGDAGKARGSLSPNSSPPKMPPLKEGWTGPHWSNTHSRQYWRNEETKKPVWERPMVSSDEESVGLPPSLVRKNAMQEDFSEGSSSGHRSTATSNSTLRTRIRNALYKAVKNDRFEGIKGKTLEEPELKNKIIAQDTSLKNYQTGSLGELNTAFEAVFRAMVMDGFLQRANLMTSDWNRYKVVGRAEEERDKKKRRKKGGGTKNTRRRKKRRKKRTKKKRISKKKRSKKKRTKKKRRRKKKTRGKR